MKSIQFILFLLAIAMNTRVLADIPFVDKVMPEKAEMISNAIIPVELSCIRVENNSDITLNWEPVLTGGGTFIEYQIFCLQSGASPIATISNINTDTYTHSGAMANLASKDYYIVTLSDCNGVIETRYSDTLSSIFLEINDLGDGRVLIEWNPTHQPQLSNEDINYQVFREYPSGVWELRRSVPYGQFSYRDTIDVCSAFLSYRVEVSHLNGCSSISNVEGDFLDDIINPYIPVISHVTVDTASQNATIFWNQNQAKDTYGYIILKLINGFWENIDTVYGIGTTSYIDYFSVEDEQSETYAVAAFDSCIVNNVPPNYQTSAASDPHSTIYVESTISICELKLSLNWTSYVGWTGSNVIEKYEILMQKGNGAFDIIATIPPEKTGFNYNGLVVNERYCFYIRAVSTNGLLSYSNQICELIIPPVNPNFHYLTKASHILGNELELEFYTDPNANALAYEVYKKGPHDFNFSLFTTVEPDGNSFYYLIDNDVNARGYYEYKVGILDSCNSTNVMTPITKTIYLNLDTDSENLVNTLTWTDYEGFDGSKIAYNIYRGENGVYDTNPIGSTPPGVRLYKDDLSDQFNSEGGFCYRIEAVESVNSYGFNRTAFSNEVCMTLDPVIHVPNAFVVNGVNGEFFPVISLYDFDSYQMEIFNRWGENIFTTQKIEFGWKGTAPNGGIVSEGIYVYRITFKDVEGKRFEETGTVLVLLKD